jgi:hypothetical protein
VRKILFYFLSVIVSSENGKMGLRKAIYIGGKCTGKQETYSWLILLRGPKASCSRLERSLSCRLRIFRLPSAEKFEVSRFTDAKNLYSESRYKNFDRVIHSHKVVWLINQYGRPESSFVTLN